MIVAMFEKDYVDKSLEELIKIRNKIIREFRRYERTNVFKQPKIQNSEGIYVYTTAGPDVEYYVANENLIMITKLILQKVKEKQRDLKM